MENADVIQYSGASTIGVLLSTVVIKEPICWIGQSARICSEDFNLAHAGYDRAQFLG